MHRRSIDSENSEDYNWCHLWETPSKKSQRRYARAWVHPLPGDLPISEALAILEHPTGPSELTVMSSNPTNHPPEDQFLLWRQEMEARQEEQARQMVELREHANQLREDNERLRTRLEANQAEKSRGPPRPLPLSRPDKGKEAVVPDDINLLADDELSFRSSPLFVVHHPRTPRKPNPEKGPLANPAYPLVPCNVGYGEKPVGTDASQSQLMNMCPNDPRALPHRYHPCILPSGLLPLHTCFSPLPSGDHRTCSPLPLVSISWITNLHVAFLYRLSPCTMALPIRTITCCISTKQ